MRDVPTSDPSRTRVHKESKVVLHVLLDSTALVPALGFLKWTSQRGPLGSRDQNLRMRQSARQPCAREGEDEKTTNGTLKRRESVSHRLPGLLGVRKGRSVRSAPSPALVIRSSCSRAAGCVRAGL
jgi:hypothetical protein